MVVHGTIAQHIQHSWHAQSSLNVQYGVQHRNIDMNYTALMQGCLQLYSWRAQLSFNVEYGVWHSY